MFADITGVSTSKNVLISELQSVIATDSNAFENETSTCFQMKKNAESLCLENGGMGF